MPEDTQSKQPDGGVSRRQFMTTVATLVPAMSIAGADSAAPARREYDVIVIGGGFCGVTAARECRKAGYSTLLLEARNRLGGRTFTANVGGRPTDMGGMWVHWSQPYVWSEIKRSGLGLSESIGANADKLIVRTRKNDIITFPYDKIGADIDRALVKYMGDSRTLLPLPHDPFGSDEYLKVDHISSRERLESLQGVSSLCRDIVDGFLASCGHNTNDQFAWLEMVRWFALAGHNSADMNDASGRFHLKEGTISLINKLVAEGKPDVRIGTPVRRVIQDDSHVTVVTNSGDELGARAVVSTVPLNVLRDIDWQPGLSDAQIQASKETHAGVGTKLHVVLEGNHGNIGCTAPGRAPINWLSTDEFIDGNTHLIGFGPDATELDVNDVESAERAVRMFLPQAKVLSTVGYEWKLDPYSKGTWCTLRPGMWSRYLKDLQKPCGRAIFASADWANGWRGFIDGAIEQGLEAGLRIRTLLS